MRRITLLFLCLPAFAADLDAKRIAELTGVEGAWNDVEKVYKVAVPRADLSVAVDGRPLAPFLGLTSWVSFQAGVKSEAMVMGDLVVLEGEVKPVAALLLDAGVEVTALHNHFLREQPRVFFLHVGGEGGLEGLARGVGAALAAIRAPPRPPGPSPHAILPDPIEALLGVKGTAKDGMFKVVVGREVALACGCKAGKEMGINSWAAFGGKNDDATVCGDFVTFPGELQPLLKALRGAGIEITAVHHHMQGEEPRALFVHYWGVGRAADLASAVRAGLDVVKEAPAGEVRVGFDEVEEGARPRGFRVEGTNPSGPDAEWEVRPGRVLSLLRTHNESGATFNLCWSPEIAFRDGTLEARVRADSGHEDQGGGLVWRARDRDNYYVARYNPLERNFRVYVVKEGRRATLDSAEELDVGAGEWFTLRVVHVADKIECSLNGVKLLDATDGSFPEAGGVGFWTKADACTSFDDLAVR
ncbi:MAG: DUF1259 domain-containing protein [Planctomycetota bacterium]